METIGFTCKKQILFTAHFHVLGLFIPKKQVKREKNPSVRRCCRRLLDEICIDDNPAALSTTDLKSLLPLSF
jgi:hypothetical protein